VVYEYNIINCFFERTRRLRQIVLHFHKIYEKNVILTMILT